MVWAPVANNSSAVERGSEGGFVLRDEEHSAGARITLERDCSNGVPFAITCGIYGWFFHTRFLGPEANAEYTLMQGAIEDLIALIPSVDDPAVDAKMNATSQAIGDFVIRFP